MVVDNKKWVTYKNNNQKRLQEGFSMCLVSFECNHLLWAVLIGPNVYYGPLLPIQLVRFMQVIEQNWTELGFVLHQENARLQTLSSFQSNVKFNLCYKTGLRKDRWKWVVRNFFTNEDFLWNYLYNTQKLSNKTNTLTQTNYNSLITK